MHLHIQMITSKNIWWRNNDGKLSKLALLPFFHQGYWHSFHLFMKSMCMKFWIFSNFYETRKRVKCTTCLPANINGVNIHENRVFSTNRKQRKKAINCRLMVIFSEDTQFLPYKLLTALDYAPWILHIFTLLLRHAWLCLGHLLSVYQERSRKIN